jgi:hypothetical protein
VPSALRIPESDRPGILLIRDLPEEVFAGLFSYVQGSSQGAPSVPGLAPEDAGEIISALRSMYQFKAYAEVSSDQFVSDVVEALRDLREIAPANEAVVRARLGRLLNIQWMDVRAKATLLFLENERTFCEARILTDARPVFGTDVSAPPLGMAIQHMLKIGFHEDTGDSKEIYFALRPQDLDELRRVIERAETKEKSLRSTLEASGVKTE